MRIPVIASQSALVANMVIAAGGGGGGTGAAFATKPQTRHSAQGTRHLRLENVKTYFNNFISYPLV